MVAIPRTLRQPFSGALAGSGEAGVIPPPVVIPDPTPEGMAALAADRLPQTVVRLLKGAASWVCRPFAYEKGADYLTQPSPHPARCPTSGWRLRATARTSSGDDLG